jgi:Tfp pilus assembly major pilin PilA
LEKLFEHYEARYLDEKYRIKRGIEEVAPFLKIIQEAAYHDEREIARKRPNLADHKAYAVVRYKPDELADFFANPYLEAFSDFKEIFFLPAGEEKLRIRNSLRTLDVKPQKLGLSLRFRIQSATSPDEAGPSVSINGQEVQADEAGLYPFKCKHRDDFVSVTVKQKSYESYFKKQTASSWLSEARKGNIPIYLKKRAKPSPPSPQPHPRPHPPTPGAPARIDYWKDGRPMDGPYTLKIILKNEASSHAIKGKLNGVFRIKELQNLAIKNYEIAISGLHKGNIIKGIIDLPGYQPYKYKFELAYENRNLPNPIREEVLLTPKPQPDGPSLLSRISQIWKKGKTFILLGLGVLILTPAAGLAISYFQGQQGKKQLTAILKKQEESLSEKIQELENIRSEVQALDSLISRIEGEKKEEFDNKKDSLVSQLDKIAGDMRANSTRTSKAIRNSIEQKAYLLADTLKVRSRVQSVTGTVENNRNELKAKLASLEHEINSHISKVEEANEQREQTQISLRKFAKESRLFDYDTYRRKIRQLNSAGFSTAKKDSLKKVMEIMRTAASLHREKDMKKQIEFERSLKNSLGSSRSLLTQAQIQVIQSLLDQ